MLGEAQIDYNAGSAMLARGRAADAIDRYEKHTRSIVRIASTLCAWRRL